MPTACRFCASPLIDQVCDFGDQPLANDFVRTERRVAPELKFPLRVMVCRACMLVQLESAPDPDVLFGEYTYLSSASAMWLDHAARFVEMAVERFALDHASMVIEIGSNDGYLLRDCVRRGIPCLGVEPAATIAALARRHGVPTCTAYFGEAAARMLSRDGRRADLLIANNVLAHAPNLLDFIQGLSLMLAPQGVLSVEVPHVLALLRGSQFDTIYHEHVFYFSALVLRMIFTAFGMTVFDVETLQTHGGSLRLLVQHTASGRHPVTDRLESVIHAEQVDGLHDPAGYAALGRRAARVIADLQIFLGRAASDGKVVAAYAAAAKGVMLLNAARIGPDKIVCVADVNPLKQGCLMPGCRIPVVSPQVLHDVRPDFMLVLAWNIAEEIMAATRFIGAWGGRFVIPSPALQIIAA